ncbi:response regulator [Bradyrhizobium sp.]|uniref:response regulator n=1 Tax=Bradyrhizobium sp. TaxID=376 RepID=UPI003C4088A0
MARILVIDDQKDVRAMICMVLRVNRFEVGEAGGAAAGLKLFEESAFDAAVVDIFLADGNGFDVIARMRDAVPDLPVVVISGVASLNAASDATAASSVVCLQKPFRPKDLIRAVESAQGLVRQSSVAEAVV